VLSVHRGDLTGKGHPFVATLELCPVMFQMKTRRITHTCITKHVYKICERLLFVSAFWHIAKILQSGLQVCCFHRCMDLMCSAIFRLQITAETFGHDVGMYYVVSSSV
jgi:hypothetical protein